MTKSRRRFLASWPEVGTCTQLSALQLLAACGLSLEALAKEAAKAEKAEKSKAASGDNRWSLEEPLSDDDGF